MLVPQLSPRRPHPWWGQSQKGQTPQWEQEVFQSPYFLPKKKKKKNPLSTNKPPCLNLYFKMKIKLKAFVLNAQIPLPFLNPLFFFL